MKPAHAAFLPTVIPAKAGIFLRLNAEDSGFRRNDMLVFVILALFFISAFPAPAHAAHFSGAYLLGLCEMDSKGRETIKGGHTACQSYIAGVLDYHALLQSMGIAPRVDICIPQNVGIGDLHTIVLNYLRKNKQHDSFVAAPAVTMALYEAYPCHTRKK